MNIADQVATAILIVWACIGVYVTVKLILSDPGDYPNRKAHAIIVSGTVTAALLAGVYFTLFY